MGKFIDLTGQRFGRLAVVERAWSRKGQLFWLCKCDCGKECVIQGSSLRGGRTRSCGCLHNQMAGERIEEINALHPSSIVNKNLYRTWSNMRQRCRNPNNPEYRNYGGRGIKVCLEWDTDFFAFERWALESGYQYGVSIDRINNDGDYTPVNCRWVNALMQSNNQRRTIMLTYKGETKALRFWADEYGLPRNVVKCRIRSGWTVERALTEPVHKKKK